MKKLKLSLFSIICFVFAISYVYAAPSYSFKVSSNSIEDGGKVTASVTVSGTAAWNIKINSAGNTNGCSQSWADTTTNGADTTKTFSTTCKANSIGSISFSVSGDISGSSGTTYLSGSKRVSVTEPKPASTINALKDLSVEGYTLAPTFDAETLEYSLTVPSTVNSIKINATKKDNASTISGDGEIEVSEGINKLEIVVTAESGDTRTYIISVNVEDTNPIMVEVDGKEYTLVKNAKNLNIPSNYIASTIKINDIDIPCFSNDINNITLVALKDSAGNIGFFKYDNGTYTKYIEINGTSLIIYPNSTDKVSYTGWNKTNITINNEEIMAFKYKNLTNYYLIYGMDVTTGKYNYYLYDVQNNTFQVFDEELFNSLKDDNIFYLEMHGGAAVLIVICLIIIII